MKRFVFSLQKVLDLRDFERKQAETELGKAVAEETKIQNTLNMIAQQRALTVTQADTLHDAQSLYGVHQYLSLLDTQKEDLLPKLAAAKLITEQKRDIMRTAMQKCKVLEQLKDKRLASWKKEAQKEEELQTDDIVTAKFGRS